MRIFSSSSSSVYFEAPCLKILACMNILKISFIYDGLFWK